MSKLVLVTGITGKQGGAVAHALVQSGHRVRGLTRNPTSDRASALTAQGIEMVAGDFSNPSSLRAACDGVDTVFAMSTPFEGGVEAEIAQGIALVDAAKASGVGHFVYSSVASADQDTGIPHFDSKYAVEVHLAASGLRWSVVAPVYFMDNLFLPNVIEGVKGGAYAIAMPADTPLQQVAVEDIGAFGAHVVSNPESFVGRRVDIASDELSAQRTAELLTDITGQAVKYVEVPIEQIRAWSDDLALMYEWFVTTGYSADVEGLRETYPDVGWHRFGDWAKAALS